MNISLNTTMILAIEFRDGRVPFLRRGKYCIDGTDNHYPNFLEPAVYSRPTAEDLIEIERNSGLAIRAIFKRITASRLGNYFAQCLFDHPEHTWDLRQISRLTNGGDDLLIWYAKFPQKEFLGLLRLNATMAGFEMIHPDDQRIRRVEEKILEQESLRYLGVSADSLTLLDHHMWGLAWEQVQVAKVSASPEKKA